MALLMANPDGSSNAVAGDVVVTGGGVFQKTDGDSVLLGTLEQWLGKRTTGSYAEVEKAFRKAKASGDYTKNIGTSKAMNGVVPESVGAISYDVNGVGTVSGFDATSYVPKTSTAGSTIVGYIVLSLVGIALLDRFMNK